jgi:hypothetical protein
MNRPDRPTVAYEANDCGFYSQIDADAYMDALEAKVAALEQQIAQAYNDGVEAAATWMFIHGKWKSIADVCLGIRGLKRPVVEAQKEPTQ